MNTVEASEQAAVDTGFTARDMTLVKLVDGVDTTFKGDVTLTGAAYNVVWDKSDNALEFADNAKAKFGNSDDLEIWHDGLNSNIKSGGAGSLIISSNFSQTGIVVVPSNKVALYYNNAQKLETTATGAAVTGAIVADSATVDDISLDGKVLTITGDTDDTFKITTGGSGATTLSTIDTAGNNGRITLDADGYIELDSGGTYGQVLLNISGTNYGEFFSAGTDFNIRSNVSDQDMKFAGKDGGVFINALRLDMSDAGAAYFNYGVNTSWHNDNYFRMYYDDSYHMGLWMEADTRDIILYTKSADSSGDIRFQTGSTPTERMTILADGKVGIGTAAPSQNLHVASTGPAVLFLEADTDNATETDNARIILSQDGGFVVGRMGFQMMLLLMIWKCGRNMLLQVV